MFKFFHYVHLEHPKKLQTSFMKYSFYFRDIYSIFNRILFNTSVKYQDSKNFGSTICFNKYDFNQHWIFISIIGCILCRKLNLSYYILRAQRRSCVLYVRPKVLRLQRRALKKNLNVVTRTSLFMKVRNYTRVMMNPILIEAL